MELKCRHQRRRGCFASADISEPRERALWVWDQVSGEGTSDRFRWCFWEENMVKLVCKCRKIYKLASAATIGKKRKGTFYRVEKKILK